MSLKTKRSCCCVVMHLQLYIANTYRIFLEKIDLFELPTQLLLRDPCSECRKLIRFQKLSHNFRVSQKIIPFRRHYSSADWPRPKPSTNQNPRVFLFTNIVYCFDDFELVLRTKNFKTKTVTY